MASYQLTDQFASVILDVPLGELDYRVPEDMVVVVGDRVLVPLGTRKMVGIVVRLKANAEVDLRKVRKIIRVLNDIAPLSSEWLSLTRFAADYYVRSWGEAALPALPSFFRKAPGVRYASSIKKLRELKTRKPKQGREGPLLNQQQQLAVDEVLSHRGFRCSVLFGVTGSGKTEVYLHIIEQVLAADAQAQVLLMVPEINLTPQLEGRVRERFVSETVVTMHSDLSQGERARSWLAVHEGRARVLVGTRMAIFASFRKLALILVDEEHDSSYKAGDGIRFSARDLAVKRAHLNDIACVLGSATPSLETWAKVRQGVWPCLHLTQRAVATAKLPKLEVIDIKGKSIDIFADAVKLAVDEALARGEQVLVFINRRGYAPVISCTACGWVSRCLHCSGFTVFHKMDRSLICHHCGARYKVPERCPSCGNLELQAVGSGTQRIEEAIERLWPQARVLRIDRDSVRCKGQAEDAFTSIHARDVDIIVGTQMIAKGHDFQHVSLVVVVNADAQLVSPDIRAEERLFSTLMQVAGRAGRAALDGKVMVQTRFADHPIYKDLQSQHYEAFADRLLETRKEAYAPPFSHQVLFTAEANTLDRALGFLRRLAKSVQRYESDSLRIYDPVPMQLMRLMDIERAQLLVESDSRTALHAFLQEAVPRIDMESGVGFTIEVDPVDV